MKTTIIFKIKEIVGYVSWKLFLWSINMNQEEYWKQIYQQEKNFLEQEDED